MLFAKGRERHPVVFVDWCNGSKSFQQDCGSISQDLSVFRTIAYGFQSNFEALAEGAANIVAVKTPPVHPNPRQNALEEDERPRL